MISGSLRIRPFCRTDKSVAIFKKIRYTVQEENGEMRGKHGKTNEKTR